MKKLMISIIALLLFAACATETPEVEVFEPKPIETDGVTVE